MIHDEHFPPQRPLVCPLLCEAIRSRMQLAFDYEGCSRIVEPYAHGFKNGKEVLRAIQIGGSSRSGTFGSGKIWHVSKMKAMRLTGAAFLPKDPVYNPNDSGMDSVHCRI